MKKLLVFITVLALISFAGCALAASGGHTNTDAEVDTKPAADYTPTSADVKAVGGTIELKESASADTPATFKATDILLPTTTANKVAVMKNITVEVTAYTAGKDVTISFENYTDKNTTDLYAFIKAKSTATTYEANKYHAFKCTVTDKVLSFTIDKPEDFFTENTVVLATVKTVSTDSGSSGGCNAGYAGLLLLAAVPFFFRKK
jgi:Synergist-CTERM protein sorting domain-containing protein